MNHKLANQNLEALVKKSTKEISTGFQFPIEIEDVSKLKGVCISPLVVSEQDAYNYQEYRVPNFRPLYDQSFDCAPNNLENHRLIKDDLPLLFYGFYLLRLVHFTYTLRWANPSQTILMSKAEFE